MLSGGSKENIGKKSFKAVILRELWGYFSLYLVFGFSSYMISSYIVFILVHIYEDES